MTQNLQVGQALVTGDPHMFLAALRIMVPWFPGRDVPQHGRFSLEYLSGNDEGKTVAGAEQTWARDPWYAVIQQANNVGRSNVLRETRPLRGSGFQPIAPAFGVTSGAWIGYEPESLLRLDPLNEPAFRCSSSAEVMQAQSWLAGGRHASLRFGTVDHPDTLDPSLGIPRSALHDLARATAPDIYDALRVTPEWWHMFRLARVFMPNAPDPVPVLPADSVPIVAYVHDVLAGGEMGSHFGGFPAQTESVSSGRQHGIFHGFPLTQFTGAGAEIWYRPPLPYDRVELAGNRPYSIAATLDQPIRATMADILQDATPGEVESALNALAGGPDGQIPCLGGLRPERLDPAAGASDSSSIHYKKSRPFLLPCTSIPVYFLSDAGTVYFVHVSRDKDLTLVPDASAPPSTAGAFIKFGNPAQAVQDPLPLPREPGYQRVVQLHYNQAADGVSGWLYCHDFIPQYYLDQPTSAFDF